MALPHLQDSLVISKKAHINLLIFQIREAFIYFKAKCCDIIDCKEQLAPGKQITPLSPPTHTN